MGIETVYAHLDRADVGVGACVSRGEIIGALGRSGFTHDAHLHFEVRKPDDPQPWMRPAGLIPWTKP
jgi:murein DD-endopeptidase MepM/ murein hydrolase activator NlpD